MKNITILGGGAFGVALSTQLSKKNNVIIWEFSKTNCEKMQLTRESNFLPEIVIPSNVLITNDLNESIKEADIVISALPSHAVEEIFRKISSEINGKEIVIASKGLSNTGELITEVLKKFIKADIYFLSGPAIAKEVSENRPTFMGLSSINKENRNLCNYLSSESFKVQISRDLIGFQIVASLKNVLAILVGLSEGFDLGENFKACLISKGLKEIEKVVEIYGGKKETVYDIQAMGDILTTSYSEDSRNRKLGVLLTNGLNVSDALNKIENVVEGIETLNNLQKKVDFENLNLNLFNLLNQFLSSRINSIQIKSKIVNLD